MALLLGINLQMAKHWQGFIIMSKSKHLTKIMYNLNILPYMTAGH